MTRTLTIYPKSRDELREWLMVLLYLTLTIVGGWHDEGIKKSFS